MPNSKPPSQHPLRDSWLPRQSFLQPNTSPDDAEIEDLDLAHIDENPLIYFLTPTPSSYAAAEDGGMEFDMDFDAGIEDAKHPPPIVRSVSPSSLGGLSLPPGSSGSPRPPTPPRSPATPDLEFDYLSATPDDDHEQYDYLHTSWPPGYANAAEALAGSPRRRLRDKFRGHAKQDPFFAAGADTLALPGSPLGSSPRGRAASRSGLGPVNLAGASSSSGRARPPRPARLSPHAWREPSPDVWAIEEETQEELNSSSIDHNNHNDIINNTWMAENGFIMEGEGHGAVVMRGGRAKAVDIPAAKPKKKKKVRFALPALEDDGRGLH